MLPLSFKGTILGGKTRTPTDKELQTCPPVTCLSAHEWDPQNVRFPKSVHNVKEEISRNIGAVMIEGGSPDLNNTASDSDSVEQIYDIDAMTSKIIGSIKVSLIKSSNVSETKAMVQDVPQAKTFRPKGRHSTVSTEELSQWWKKGLKQARDTTTKTTKRLTCSAVIPLVKKYKKDRVF